MHDTGFFEEVVVDSGGFYPARVVTVNLDEFSKTGRVVIFDCFSISKSF